MNKKIICLTLLCIMQSCMKGQNNQWEEFRGDYYIESLREDCSDTSETFQASFIIRIDASEIKGYDKNKSKIAISADYLIYYGDVLDKIEFEYVTCDKLFLSKLRIFTLRLIDKDKNRQMIFSCKEDFQFNQKNDFYFKLKKYNRNDCDLIVRQSQ